MTDTTQGTEDWIKARLGKATASRMGDLTAKTKSGWSATRDNYMAELLVERMTGAPFPHYVSAAMQRGTDEEPNARTAYEFERNVEVKAVGFVEHPAIAMTGASPDGLVGGEGEGMIEIKCPEVKQHLETLLGSPIDGGHVKQMQWQMACADRSWCDWISYCPLLPVQLQLKIVRVHFDGTLNGELTKEVIRFLDELDAKEKQLWKLLKAKAA